MPSRLCKPFVAALMIFMLIQAESVAVTPETAAAAVATSATSSCTKQMLRRVCRRYLPAEQRRRSENLCAAEQWHLTRAVLTPAAAALQI